MARLEGKTAIITGAGTGIGRAAGELFAAKGANVVLADIDGPAVEETAARIAAAGGRAMAITCDITEEASVAALMARAIDGFGRIDVLYNNAGGSSREDGPVTEVALEEFWRTLRLDLYGTVLCSRLAIPHIVAAGGGAVVNTGSMVAAYGRQGAHSYTAAKGGITSLTRAMAAEYAAQGVRVNAVAPGITRSPRVEARLAEGRIRQSDLDRHRLGLPEPIDIAQAALFLASDAARRITGHVLPVDSGMTAF
ncbi:SDR family NAD(P)-dependent oxidoreductase [Pseudogemmobacter sonorensis]|uniref:SDR family NAD(P)-dependent oxidoreductase n=1 Tax=Pseudogemmobacter sonorensis TaxID=2989681 RepID=UPI0036C3D087